MATTLPSIACLGVIGRNKNPLLISIFPSYDPVTDSLAPVRTPLQFSLLLSSTLDVFELRTRSTVSGGAAGGGAAAPAVVSGDLGLLHALDDRLAAYGFETNTGVRFVVVVDMRGRRLDVAAATAAANQGLIDRDRSRGASAVGLRDGEMKPVFRAMQTAYVRLLQNPFHDPDEHSPPNGRGGKKITSKRFMDDMRRIGETWTPGVTSL